MDNVNYARATSYNYETGIYESSGVVGYNYVRNITSLDFDWRKFSLSAVYTDIPLTIGGESFKGYNNREVKLIKYDAGYKHRTNDKCRVRAVRKMTE